MSYCTLQDLIGRGYERELIELTDRSTPPAGVVDTALVDRAITDADALIDSYLQTRYTLPLAVVPATLERVACDLVRYFLHADADAVTETVRAGRDQAVSFLRTISRGEADIGPTAGGERPQGSGGAQIESGGRLFGRDSGGLI